MRITVCPAEYPGDVEAVRRLLKQYADSLPFCLEYHNFEAELAGLPEPYVPPYGRLLAARRGAVSAGTVGLKRLADDTAEVKRLFVVPQARGHGIGRLLLTHIIEEARGIGYDRLRLDSHRASMTTAISLYRQLGFTQIAPMGPISTAGSCSLKRS
jgi:putative acetyltransferase